MCPVGICELFFVYVCVCLVEWFVCAFIRVVYQLYLFGFSFNSIIFTIARWFFSSEYLHIVCVGFGMQLLIGCLCTIFLISFI